MHHTRRWLVTVASLTMAAGGWSPRAQAQIKVACVGDSITAGVGATTGNGYPSVLGRLLGPAWRVSNFGNSGKTMMKAPSDPPNESYWLQPTYPASKASAPAVVVIMLGTNDSKTANWRGGNNQYDADYRSMIGEFVALASKPRIFAVLPPPTVMGSFTIDGMVIQNQIVPIIRKIAADIPGLGLIDGFDAFQPMPGQYFVADGVHPNDKGHALLAQTVYKALVGAFGDDGGVDSGSAIDGGADADAAARVEASDAGATGNPGSGGATGSGGMNGGSVDASGSDATDSAGGGVMPASDSAGCSCRAAGPTPSGASASLVVLGAALAAFARRRRSRRPVTAART